MAHGHNIMSQTSGQKSLGKGKVATLTKFSEKTLVPLGRRVVGRLGFMACSGYAER